VVGVSMGAFAAANASPRMPWVESLTLESPYPSFNAWYGGRREARIMAWFDRAFPRSSAAIQADRNVAYAVQKRVLVAYAERDDVTPPSLSRAVGERAPRDRTVVLPVAGVPHLGLIDAPEYREALLKHLG
ncbi:MAG TPA: hypothetical protein VNX21_04770, partial [Candidatus Thermoplasmatota archaeon]|nr:hypothetical protein [Candidatus Thermoplasmatota archaeon]